MVFYSDRIDLNSGFSTNSSEITYIADFEKGLFLVIIKYGRDEDSITYYNSFESLKDFLHYYPWDITEETIKEASNSFVLNTLLFFKKKIELFLEALDDIDPPTHTPSSD